MLRTPRASLVVMRKSNTAYGSSGPTPPGVGRSDTARRAASPRSRRWMASPATTRRAWLPRQWARDEGWSTSWLRTARPGPPASRASPGQALSIRPRNAVRYMSRTGHSSQPVRPRADAAAGDRSRSSRGAPSTASSYRLRRKNSEPSRSSRNAKRSPSTWTRPSPAGGPANRSGSSPSKPVHGGTSMDARAAPGRLAGESQAVAGPSSRSGRTIIGPRVRPARRIRVSTSAGSTLTV